MTAAARSGGVLVVPTVVSALLCAFFLTLTVLTARHRAWSWAIPLSLGLVLGLVYLVVSLHGVEPRGRT